MSENQWFDFYGLLTKDPCKRLEFSRHRDVPPFFDRASD
jgi:hypothetical protein